MPIMICSKCKKPIKDSFHSFKETCKCEFKKWEARHATTDLREPFIKFVEENYKLLKALGK